MVCRSNYDVIVARQAFSHVVPWVLGHQDPVDDRDPERDVEAQSEGRDPASDVQRVGVFRAQTLDLTTTHEVRTKRQWSDGRIVLNSRVDFPSPGHQDIGLPVSVSAPLTMALLSSVGQRENLPRSVAEVAPSKVCDHQPAALPLSAMPRENKPCRRKMWDVHVQGDPTAFVRCLSSLDVEPTKGHLSFPMSDSFSALRRDQEAVTKAESLRTLASGA